MVADICQASRWLSGKEPACQCRRCKRRGFNPWVWKSPERGHGNAVQYSCLENPMDRGAGWAAKSRTRLSRHAVCVSVLISQFSPPPPSPVFIFVVYACVSVPSWRQVHLCHFSRFHMYPSMYKDVCFSFSDFLHSVWQTLGPST